jgi:hypothetical protein
MQGPERGSRKFLGRPDEKANLRRYDVDLSSAGRAATGSMSQTTQAPSNKPAPAAEQRDPRERVVQLTKGFFASMPSRATSYVDLTTEALYAYNADHAIRTLVLSRTVPQSRIWLIDNFYFYARKTEPFNRLAPAGDIENEVAMVVEVGGSMPVQYEYTLSDIFGVQYMSSQMPFLLDRLGPRETSFGIWLLENETISAYYKRSASAIFGPPAAPIAVIGFRFQAYQTDKSVMEQILEEQSR